MEDTAVIEHEPVAADAAPVSQAVDYFGAMPTYDITLPDGVQTITCQKMNEGARSKYSQSISQDVTLHRQTGDVKMKLQDGIQRKAMLQEVIIDWTLVKRRNPTDLTPTPYNFTASALSEFLRAAPPEVIDSLYEEVLDHEPWARGEVTEEDLDKAQEDLDKRRAELKAKEAEGNS